MARTPEQIVAAEVNHEERDVHDLPTRLQRFRVRIAATPGGLADQWSEEAQEFQPITTEIRVSVDPTEFLDYVTLAEFLQHEHDHGFISYGTDAERAQLVNAVDAIDRYEVAEVFDEIRDMLAQGRTDDALRAMDAFENPKFKSLEACKAALDGRAKA